MGLSGDEEPTPMSRARLSGPSRLAFRINTDDFETGDQGGRIEFSVSELTNWSRHELVVIRRAQKLLKAYADGSRRPRWDMQEDHDLAAQLVHMGFSRGGWADRSKSKQREHAARATGRRRPSPPNSGSPRSPHPPRRRPARSRPRSKCRSAFSCRRLRMDASVLGATFRRGF